MDDYTYAIDQLAATVHLYERSRATWADVVAAATCLVEVHAAEIRKANIDLTEVH